MNPKHLKIRIDQCKLIASNSPCPRGQVGAIILDPESNAIISDGFNGTPRKSTGQLCSGSFCKREIDNIVSGTQNDIGCHHAEANAILNAARIGVSTLNRWLIVNRDPCLMCSKLIHHAGIIRVYSPKLVKTAGLTYLRENGVEVIAI
jgi:dCMP deaminase